MISAIPPSLTSFFPGAWGPFASALANHLWQSTFFVAIAALFALALRNNHARARYWLWFAASAKFLFPFSLLVLLGAHLAWLHPTAKPTAVTNPATYLVMEEVGQPFDMTAPTLPTATLSLSRTARLRAALGGSFFPAALAVIWLAGFLFVLARWISRWSKIVAVLRHAPALTSGREAGALQRITHAGGLGRSIALKSLPIAIEPGIFGIFCPVLLWPEALSPHLDDAQLEAILAHEVCHVRRRDNLTSALHMAVEAVFWFHPLVWWMETRLIAEREAACDEEVLTLCGHARAYAESILKVCEFSIVSPLPCISGVTGADLRQRIAAIITARAFARISWPKKLLLAFAATSVIAAPIALGLAHGMPVLAQILRATGPLPSYEVATIKPEVAPHIPGNVPKNIRRFTGTTKDLIEGAYNIPYGADGRVVGGPGWISSNRYVINGKIPDDVMATMQTMDGTRSRMQNALMKQSLLADRFKLKVHFETRELPVYALVVAKGGPRMKPTDPNAAIPPLYFPPPGGEQPDALDAPPVRRYMNTFGPNHRLVVNGDGRGVLEMKTNGVDLDNVAQSLEEVADDLDGRTIVNRTGLDGQYDFTLKWTPQQTANSPGADSAAAESDAPSIFTALEEQLGLKLVPAKGPVEVIVIDHIEKPSLDDAEVQPTAPALPAALAQEKPVQATTPAKPWRFEVVSIRKNTTGGGTREIKVTDDSWIMTDQPLSTAIRVAYPPTSGEAFFGKDEVEGLPSWANDDNYDIVAKLSESALAEWKQPGRRPAMMQAMLQQMLVDRCGLVVHRGSKETSLLALTVAKGGPKFKLADPNAQHPPGQTIPGMGTMVRDDSHTMHLYDATISLLANLFAKGDGASTEIQDRTGLTGRYDMVVHLPEPPPRTGDDGVSPPDREAMAMDMANQLGLKLTPAKGTVETLVIDHIERPSEN